MCEQKRIPCFAGRGERSVWVDHDVALLWLEEPESEDLAAAFDAIPTLVVNAEPLSDDLSVHPVGYGMTETDGPIDVEKRIADSHIAELNPSYFELPRVKGDIGGICNGDSGGATVSADDGERRPIIVGINSATRSYSCNSEPLITRADAHAAWLSELSEGEITFRGEVDDVPPTVDTIWPSDGAELGQRFLITAQVSDETRLGQVDILIDDEPQGSWDPNKSEALVLDLRYEPYAFIGNDDTFGSFRTTEDLAAFHGEHTLSIVVSDGAGNRTTIDRKIVIDTERSLDIRSPFVRRSQLSEYVQPALILAPDLPEENDVVVVELYVDGARKGISVDPPFTFSLELDGGEHEIEWVAIDQEGNEGRRRREVTVDVAPPTVRVVSPENPLVDTFFRFELEVDDDTEIEHVTFSIDGDELESVNYPPYTVYIERDPGEYLLHATATDVTGRETSIEYQFVVREELFSPFDDSDLKAELDQAKTQSSDGGGGCNVTSPGATSGLGLTWILALGIVLASRRRKRSRTPPRAS